MSMVKLLSEVRGRYREWLLDDGKRVEMTLLANYEISIRVHQTRVFGLFKNELGGWNVKCKSSIKDIKETESRYPASELIDAEGLTGLSALYKQTFIEIPKNAMLETLMVALMAYGKTYNAMDNYLMNTLNGSNGSDWSVERYDPSIRVPF